MVFLKIVSLLTKYWIRFSFSVHSTFELGDNGVLRMQSHYCGRPVGLCQIPLQITFDLPTGVSKISSCGVNLLTLGAGHVVQWCTLCRSHGKVKPSQLILSASHVDLAPNFSGTLFGISNTVSGGGMGSIAPLVCFIIQIKSKPVSFNKQSCQNSVNFKLFSIFHVHPIMISQLADSLQVITNILGKEQTLESWRTVFWIAGTIYCAGAAIYFFLVQVNMQTIGTHL